MVSTQCYMMKVLFLLFFSFAIAESFGANENDPEGYIRKGINGRYSYLPATATSSRTEDTPEISSYEDHFNPSGTNETSVEPSPEQDFSLRNRKEPKSNTRSQYRIGYSSMTGGIRGGAAGRANFGK